MAGCAHHRQRDAVRVLGVRAEAVLMSAKLYRPCEHGMLTKHRLTVFEGEHRVEFGECDGAVPVKPDYVAAAEAIEKAIGPGKEMSYAHLIVNAALGVDDGV